MAQAPEEVAARIVALEKSVDWLQRDLAALRQQIACEAPTVAPVAAPAVGSVAAPALAPAAAPPRPLPHAREPVIEALPSPPRARLDLETLVGRYGMLALATVLALSAVGSFVGWAMAHGLLGPVPRVLLGLLAAGGFGAWGVWLRPRERSFGDALLGIALATTHVCAWAAGPSLHLVPPFLALVLSAVASVALAGFALKQHDEPLWCVGFGGAALAPFVTSTGEGTAPMLAAYAAAVLIAAGSALGSRAWPIAARVFGGAAALFVAALVALPASQHSVELALALPFAVGALGVIPFAEGAAIRPRLRMLGLLAGAAALNVAAGNSLSRATSAFAVALAGLAWLVVVELVESEPAGTLLDGFGPVASDLADWVDGAVIPFAFLASLAFVLHPTDAATAAFALAAAVLTFSCSRREGTLRDAAALVAFGAAVAAASNATRSSLQLEVVALTSLSVLFVLLERIIPNRTWRWAPQLALFCGALIALGLVTERPSYQYLPFGTSESATALAVALGWAAVAMLSKEGPARPLALIFAFCWVHQELAFAVSPSTSTLLLVSWYASTGVACVGFGRARAAPRLRHVGLGLGVVAALLALKAAWGMPSTGARIASYLVVSVFLLGIAWWYRRPGPAPESAAAASGIR